MTLGVPSVDVAVIGGGMVGLASALHLVMRGRSVAVLDRGGERAKASFGNAGVINRGSIFPVAGPGLWPNLLRYARNADPAVQLRYSALPATVPWLVRFLKRANAEAWREAAAALDPLTAVALGEHIALAEEVGARDLIAQRGYLKLYRSEAAFAASSLEREILAHHRVRTEILDAGEIAAAEPALTRRFAKAILFSESGAVDRPGELLARYRAALIARGGTLVEASCERIEPTPDGVVVRWLEHFPAKWIRSAGENASSNKTGADSISVETALGGSILARQVVLAAGAWSGALARPLGYRFPLAAERGYHRHYRMARNLTRPVHDTGGAYVLSPMGDGTVRLLCGIELARPDDPKNPRQLAMVQPEAARNLALGDPVEAEPWCGSRPSTPDGLPIIGRAPHHPNVIFAFGHGHIGLSTGPITGRIVADLVDQRAPPLPVAPFAPERFLQS